MLCNYQPPQKKGGLTTCRIWGQAATKNIKVLVKGAMDPVLNWVVGLSVGRNKLGKGLNDQAGPYNTAMVAGLLCP